MIGSSSTARWAASTCARSSGPTLFLAGGTGLAPFLSMLDKIETTGSEHPVHLIFGVTNEPDLVRIDELEGYAARIPNFTFTCCVAAEDSNYPNKGYVTRYMTPERLNNGIVDIYLCGPPPMVDAVRTYLSDQGITPANFYYEKFSGTGVVSEIGESHVKVVDSDEAFDARMALELGAAQLVIGRLTPDQLLEYRRLAEATGTHIKDGRFRRPGRFPRRRTPTSTCSRSRPPETPRWSRRTASSWSRSTWAMS